MCVCQLLCLHENALYCTIGAKKIDAKTKKTANIEKAVTFFLEEIEQKFKQI